MIWTFTPVSGHGASSGSNVMTVARRECVRAGAAAMLVMSGWSVSA
jgi:hypothetical protein